jgi:hypothetical protein
MNFAFRNCAIAAGFFSKSQETTTGFVNKKGANLLACVLRIQTAKLLVAKKERG